MELCNNLNWKYSNSSTGKDFGYTVKLRFLFVEVLDKSVVGMSVLQLGQVAIGHFRCFPNEMGVHEEVDQGIRIVRVLVQSFL